MATSEGTIFRDRSVRIAWLWVSLNTPAHLCLRPYTLWQRWNGTLITVFVLPSNCRRSVQREFLSFNLFICLCKPSPVRFFPFLRNLVIDEIFIFKKKLFLGNLVIVIMRTRRGCLCLDKHFLKIRQPFTMNSLWSCLRKVNSV